MISRLSNYSLKGSMKNEKEPDTLDFLLAQVSHLHHQRVHQLLERIGLYRGQPGVLFALWEQEGLTQTELANQMQNSPATVSKMLQRMEKAGFIQRRPDADDQRVTRVYLTCAGRDVKQKVETVFTTLEAEDFANLTSEECDVLRRLLLQVRQNLATTTGEEGWK